MGENSKIEWTDHTFNGWIGCTKIDPLCDGCYAERDNNFRKWNGGEWGPGAPRQLTSESNWRNPFKWDRAAQESGQRKRVFAFSLADVFDAEGPLWPQLRPLPNQPCASGYAGHRAIDVFFHHVVAKAPHLDWLILTKRYERAADYLDRLWGSDPWPNVSIVFSAGTQKRLIQAANVFTQFRAIVKGVSTEPLLEPLEFEFDSGINWVIVGGESGPNARPIHPEWVRSIRDQCQSAKIPFFFKQWGEWTPGENVSDNRQYPVQSYGVDGQWRVDSDDWISEANNGPLMYRVGKKAAGRLLDGREWNDFPKKEGSVL